MTRRALLIGSPGAPGTETYLHGVAQDLASYHRFLSSPLGGAWRKDEIVTLRSPTTAEVSLQLEQLKKVDYSFTMFGGHGCYSARSRSTVIDLRPGVELNSAALRIGAPRHTLMLDCCRVVMPEVRTESLMAKAAHVLRELDPERCRQVFDGRISRCAPGLVVLYSCGIGEEAGDSAAEGGYYSAGLIEVTGSWEKSQPASKLRPEANVLSVVGVHIEGAKIATTKSGGRQHPTHEAPRATEYFPFAVVG